MSDKRIRYDKNRLYLPGVAWGVGLGLALVVLVTATRLSLPPPADRAWPVLLRALVIYAPAGYLAAVRVARARRSAQSRLRLAPPAVHALIVGAVLAVLHAAVLLAVNAGISPGLEWFVTEAALAALLAGAAGLFARQGEA